MGRLNVDVPDDVEIELRSIVPNKRGALSDAVTSALKMFLKEKKKHGK